MSALTEIDQRLSAWDERLLRVDENLLALEGESTYQMLAGGAGKPSPLEGITAERVRPALDAMVKLFEQRERLTEVLDRAKAIRASIGFFGADDKIKEIEDLLDGPSIRLGTEHTPLAQRNLLDVAAREVSVVPEELLNAMVHAFNVARDAVAAVANAWSKLEPSLLEAETDVAALRRDATSMEVVGEAGARAELEGIEQELSKLRRRVARDPLGVQGAIGQTLAPRVAELRRSLGALVALRDRVERERIRARAVHDELRSVHASAKRAAAEGARERPLEDALLADLDRWWTKLEATRSEGHLARAEVGLSKFIETAETYLAADRAVVASKEAAASKLAELRGRISARRAQLSALRARGVDVSPALDQQADEADALLRTAPSELARAESLVEALDAQVAALAHKR